MSDPLNRQPWIRVSRSMRYYFYRRRWIKWRNRIDDLLALFGVPIFTRCNLANNILHNLGYPPPNILRRK